MQTVKCEFCGLQIREADAREWPAAFPGRRRIYVCPKCDDHSGHLVQAHNTIKMKNLRKGKEWSK